MLRRLLSLAAAVILYSPPLGAQIPPGDFAGGHATGFGYTGAVPRAEIGIGGFHLLGIHGLGVFADAKMTLGSVQDDTDYCPPPVATCDVAWAESNRNDLFVRDIDEWLIVNAGVMRGVTRELALMLGGGVARRTTYREYYDDVTIGDPITTNRSYYVDNPESNGWKPNLVAGALFRLHRNAAIRIGYETAPGGLSLGGYWTLWH